MNAVCIMCLSYSLFVSCVCVCVCMCQWFQIDETNNQFCMNIFCFNGKLSAFLVREATQDCYAVGCIILSSVG